MAVSKRLRYEIFRRDNHACRYCGASAPDVPLRIDHVTPVALGGTDVPENLVTACEPCNSGKTSTNPGAPLVADVAQDALRWSQAMQKAVADAREAQIHVDEYRDYFESEWDRWTFGHKKLPVPLPDDWRQSLTRFQTAGIPAWMWDDIVQSAMANIKVKPTDKFRYCCGIAWKKVTELQEAARKHLQPTDDTDIHPSLQQILEVAVGEWGGNYSGPNGEDANEELGAVFRASVLPLLEELGVVEIMDGAQHAGWFGATDLAEGIKHAERSHLFDRQYVAMYVWERAWATAANQEPTREQRDAFWKSCLPMYDADAHPVTVITAAAIAGFHMTDRMYFGIESEISGLTRLEGHARRAEDLWARSWFESSRRLCWPTEDEREAFRAEWDVVLADGGYLVSEVFAAAIAAGVYNETRLGHHLTRADSVFEAAARPLGSGL